MLFWCMVAAAVLLAVKGGAHLIAWWEDLPGKIEARRRAAVENGQSEPRAPEGWTAI